MPPKASRPMAKIAALPVRLDNGDDSDEEYLEPTLVYRTPADQLSLTEDQKNELMPRLLTAANPNVSRAITRFSFSDSVFKLETSVDHLAVHFQMEGELIHVNSDEAREQQSFLSDRKDSAEKKNAATQFDEAVGSVEASIQGKLLRNQFNFSERATQTFNNPRRDRKVSTEPPATENFSASVNHWEIYDAYLEELDRHLVSKSVKKSGEKDEKGDVAAAAASSSSAQASSSASASPAASAAPTDLIQNPKLLNSLKLMERLVNQNAENDTFFKFKYFEDKDEHRQPDGRGGFSTLWRFAFEKAKKKTVTAIAWNPQFTDLFAVSYGSYEFLRQGAGLIACYSLKNTSFPEFVFATESGVMCLDWHPQHAALLAAGLYDGTVAVYDVRNASGKPIYVSSDPKVKHTDPVWQVRWAKEEPGKNINFYSISSDGRVTNWIMNKNELVNEEVAQIKLVSKKEDGKEDEATLGGLAGGSSFDFNPFNESLFVLGTEEGALHSYSKAFHTQHLRTYEGHQMSVYTVKWNPFHPRVFLSCSADWTVKLWEHGTSQPIMTFDLKYAVNDIAWAPYSSTVFAVITNDFLFVYDLNVNKHEPIGSEQPRLLRKEDAKSKMTHVAFNPEHPIIVVGDDRGVIRTFKLGPNLHKMSAPRLDDLSQAEEQAKLERLLIIPEKSPEAEALNSLNLLGPLPPIAANSKALAVTGAAPSGGDKAAAVAAASAANGSASAAPVKF